MTTPGHNMPQHEGNITMTQTSNRHHPQRALVVIDVQNEYVTGNLRIEYPPVEDSLRNIGKAIDGARSAGIPVVVVQQMSPTPADRKSVVTGRGVAERVERGGRR